MPKKHETKKNETVLCDLNILGPLVDICSC